MMYIKGLFFEKINLQYFAATTGGRNKSTV